jgi:hypothetical protein
MQPFLKQYVRVGYVGQDAYNEYGTRFEQQNRGPKIGVLIALDKDKIGWSLLSEKENLNEKTTEKRVIKLPDGQLKTITIKVPVWTTKRIWQYGTLLAYNRATGEVPTPKIVPNIIKRELKRFQKVVEAKFS